MTFIKNLKKILPYSFKQKCWDLFDSFKINIATNFIPEIGIDDFINKLNRKPKIAFVKQVTATDLYCCSKNASQKEIIFSSFHRSGPVALFTKFNADFYIVNLDSAQECNAWKYNSQEYNGSRSPLAEIEKYINEIISKDTPFGKRILNKYPQSTFALNADSIDWSNYDIVISNFISIPSRITQKHSKVIWCYMPSNPDNKVYKESHKKPVDGYDFFLNCKNRIIKLNSIPKKHEIDFPYSFHYYGCFHDLLNIKPNSINKEGIFIENRTASSLTQQEFQTLTKYGTVRFPMEEPLESVIDKELKSKYFLSLTRGVIRSPIWGSGMIEAIACGCLAFGDPNDYTNKDTFNSFSSISSFEEFMKKINFLESNPEKYRIELERQRRQINYLCFTRPIKEILDKSRTLNRNIAYFN